MCRRAGSKAPETCGKSRRTTSFTGRKITRTLVVAFRSGSPVRLCDVASVKDSVEDLRTIGLVNGKPAVSVILFRQPGANIIATVDRVVKLLPQLAASLPGNVKISVALDRTTTIRASLRDVERNLFISGILVILVVFGFLRNVRSALIPCIAIPCRLSARSASCICLASASTICRSWP